MLKDSTPGSAPPLLEQGFAVLALLIYSGALMVDFFPPPEHGGAIAASNAPIKLFLFVTLYSITGILLLRDFAAALKLLVTHKYLTLLLLYCAASTLWSVEPGESIEKSAGIAGASMLALYLALRFPFATLLRVLTIVLSTIVVVSYLTALLVPDIGVMQGLHEGLWSGVFRHKNRLGFYATLAGVVFLAGYLRSRPHRSWYMLGYILSATLLFFSCSKSSHLAWILLFVAIGLYLGATGLRRPALICLLSVTLCSISLGAQFQYKVFPPLVLNQILHHVALDANVDSAEACESRFCDWITAAPPSAKLHTGAGRIRLWSLLGERVGDRPLLGYGIGGFWLGSNGPSAQVWERVGWKTPHAHNGFIDLILHLGLVGAALFLLFIFAAIKWTLQACLERKLDIQSLTYAAILACILLANIGESFLLVANSLPWILLLLATIRLTEYSRTPNQMAAEKNV